MCSLVGFPPLPPEGHISICEMFGKVHSVPADQADLNFVTNAISKHPTVTITRELLRTSLYREELKEVFLPVHETLVKRLVHIWYEQGMVEALKSLANPSHGDIPPLLQQVASFMLKVARGVTQIRNTFHPHLRECGPKLIAAVAQTRDWDTCPIRCLAWHPHCTKLAVAAWDDSVRVFSSNSGLTPVLKCKNQRAISCLAWRPLSASELAVGCEEGVYVWQVDPNSVVTHPSTNCATILKRYGHSPVTSIAWSPQGDILLTASAHDTTMYAWDVTIERYTPIKRMGGGGVCMVAWAPSGSHVFAAASGIVFRVWETRKWIPERWTVMSGRVQTACWSPCGSVLMFATTEEPVIYSLTLSGAQILYQAKDTPPKVALRAVDLTPIELESGDRLGGLVHSLAWDHLGHHLAVLFKDCDVVAIFKTQLTPLLLVAPCCLVQGLREEVPNAINFQKNFFEGAVLTIVTLARRELDMTDVPQMLLAQLFHSKLMKILKVYCIHWALQAWSSGRVQHFPLLSSDYSSGRDLSQEISCTNSVLTSSMQSNANASVMSCFRSPC